MKTIYLDASFFTEKEKAHAYIKRKLKFPAHYGENLDALADCLGDLGEVEIVIHNTSHAGAYYEKLLPVFLDKSEETEKWLLTTQEARFSKTKITDMTTGSPLKHILTFAVPLLIGNLFQQFYNMVDSLIVGNYVGSDALAAVGTCGSVNFLFFSLSSGLATGIGVIVAQYFGAHDHDRVRTTIANSFYVLITASLVVSVLGFILAPVILRLMSTPAGEVYDNAVLYMRTTCCGIIGIAMYNGVSSILRALGDSRTPLYFLILSSIINVVLDLTFVLGLGLEVFGVALATIIAQFISAITCLIYAFKKVEFFHLTRAQLKPEKKIIVTSYRLGVPIALQGSMIAISCIVLQSVVNGFGPVVMAAFTITSRIEQLVQQPYSSLSAALTTYCGQNIGAGDVDRVKKGFRKAVMVAITFSLIMLPLAFFAGKPIVSIFIKKEEVDVITMAAKSLRITSPFYSALAMIYMPRALMNGCGDTMFSMINGIAEVACRVVFSQVFIHLSLFGYWSVWVTTGLTWLVVSIVCIIRYFSGVWKTKALK